ncbi:hypothetical protein ALT721_1050037 [Alteromonas alvinellae]
MVSTAFLDVIILKRKHKPCEIVNRKAYGQRCDITVKHTFIVGV